MLELYVGVYLLGVLISSVLLQVLLKKAAMRQYETPLKEYLNPSGYYRLRPFLRGNTHDHPRLQGSRRFPWALYWRPPPTCTSRSSV